MQIVKPEDFKEKVMKLFGTDWALLTAGDRENYNTMTIAWGTLGYLWNKNVCFVFVRPQRYTYQFMEENEFFTLTFFEEKYKNALNFCGTHSGRDVDKVEETGLTLRETENNVVYFEEARILIECKKIYFQDIKGENFLDLNIDKSVYPTKDYHRLYIGEINKIFVKQPLDEVQV